MGSWKDEYPYSSNWHQCGDHRMHYLDEGPKDAPTIVMVHGNPTWSFYYRHLIEAFKATHRCIVPDHIGCGLSDKPQNYSYTLKQRIDDLESLLLSLDLKTPFTLVIHDWGGAIGMGYGARHPEHIRDIVVFNTAAFRSKRIPFSINICKIPLFGDIMVRGFNGFVQVAQIRAIHDKRRLKGAPKSGYLAPYDSWQNRIAVHQFVKDIPMDPKHPSYQTLVDVEDGLTNFTDRPMLIVWGEQDFCFNASFREEWSRRFPHAQVHKLDDASHYVVEDAHERIIPWMQTFLKENAA